MSFRDEERKFTRAFNECQDALDDGNCAAAGRHYDRALAAFHAAQKAVAPTPMTPELRRMQDDIQYLWQRYQRKCRQRPRSRSAAPRRKRRSR